MAKKRRDIGCTPITMTTTTTTTATRRYIRGQGDKGGLTDLTPEDECGLGSLCVITSILVGQGRLWSGGFRHRFDH